MDALILCTHCGRALSNDPEAANAAEWTLDAREPYCADSCIAETQTDHH